MLTLSDEQRSMIATCFAGACAAWPDEIEARARGLCCALDATSACAAIVGSRAALRLRSWLYDRLGCAGSDDPEYHAQVEQLRLDKIAALESI